MNRTKQTQDEMKQITPSTDHSFLGPIELKQLLSNHRGFSRDKGSMFRNFMKETSQGNLYYQQKQDLQGSMHLNPKLFDNAHKQMRSTTVNKAKFVPPAQLDKYLDSFQRQDNYDQYMRYDISATQINLSSNNLNASNNNNNNMRNYNTIDRSTTQLEYDEEDEYNTEIRPYQYIRTQPNEAMSKKRSITHDYNQNWDSRITLSNVTHLRRKPSQSDEQSKIGKYYRQKSSVKNDSVFVGTDRFLNEKNQSLSKYGMSNINPMLSDTVAQDKKENLENGRKFLLENLYFPQLQQFDQGQLNDVHKHDQHLKSPNQRRSEFEEMKEQLNKYQQFQVQLKQRNHAHGILQGSFQSGIMQFDSPERDDTVIYEREQQNTEKIADVIQNKLSLRFQKNMPFLVTNPNIIPINNGLSILKENQMNQFPSQVHEVDPLWKQKKRVSEGIHNFDTHQQVLGDKYSDLKNYYNSQRASYLRSKQTNNQDYNIVTGVQNKQVNL